MNNEVEVTNDELEELELEEVSVEEEPSEEAPAVVEEKEEAPRPAKIRRPGHYVPDTGRRKRKFSKVRAPEPTAKKARPVSAANQVNGPGGLETPMTFGSVDKGKSGD